MAKSNYHDGHKRDKCYFCGCGGPLEEHHIIPQRFGGPDTKENIVELCQLCHRRLERLYDKSFYEWFGIDDSKGRRLYHRPCQSPVPGRKCDERPEFKIQYGPRDLDGSRGAPIAEKVVCGNCWVDMEHQKGFWVEVVEDIHG